jgi:phasin
MIEPKLEVPAELRDLAEKTIDQAEKAFGMFFDAAGKSMTSIPGAGTEISKQALSFTEQNMKAAFEHARKLVHATDLQEAMRIQSEFLRSQFTNAGEHMRQITGGVARLPRTQRRANSEGLRPIPARDGDAEQESPNRLAGRLPGDGADGRSAPGCRGFIASAGDHRNLKCDRHIRDRA